MTDAAVANLRSPEHFIQLLDLGWETLGDGRLVMTTETTHPPDAGLLGTIVDVIGGSLVIRRRPQAGIPTTNLELHGIDQLVQPGVVRVEASMVWMSKRRATIEAMIDVAGRQAWATAGFVVRDDPNQPPIAIDAPRPPRRGRVLDTPLWQEIGAARSSGAATVSIEPRLYNNATALQGGATIALLEAAATTVVDEHERIASASIGYLQQVRGDTAQARVRRRIGDLVIVDVRAGAVEGSCATAVFGVTRAV